MQNIGSWSDRIAAQEKRASRLLRRHDQSPCSSRVTVYVGVHAGHDTLRLHTIGRNRSMNVMTEIITSLNYFGISLKHRRFLCKLIFQQMKCAFKRAVKKPAHKTESEYIATL